MNIDQLKGLIKSSIANAEFNLEAAQLGNDAVRQLATTFLTGKIAIKNPKVEEPDGNSIKVAGTGVGFPFDGMDVEATFSVQIQDAAVVIRATPSDDWRFDRLFPQLSNSIFAQINFADAEFCLASYAVSDAESQGLSFSGLLRLMPSLKDLDFLFGKTGVRVSGPIELDQGAPKMALKAEVVSNLGLGFLNLPEVMPHLRSVPVYNSQDKRTNADAFLLFDTNIVFSAKGNTYQIPLAAKVYSPETNILFTANLTEAVDASMAELSSLLNGMSPGAILPDNFHIEDAVTLTDLVIQVNPSAQNKVLFVTAGAQTTKSWTLVDQLTLESVKLFFRLDDPSGAKELSFAVTSDLRLGDSVLEFNAFSDLSFSGGLKEGSTLRLKELCKHFGLDDEHIPQLNVDDLEFSIEPNTNTYSFQAFIHSDWNIGIDNFELKLEEVLLSAAHSAPDVTNLEFEAKMKIGGVTLAVKASRPSAAEGLSLSGKTAAGERVRLGAFIGDIFAPFDFDVPESLPDFSLKNVSIDYNFNSQKLALQAEDEVTSSLRLGNVTHDVDTTVNLTITKDSTTGHRTYSGRLLGSVTFGSAVFLGEYDFADASVLKATWDGKTGSLRFSDLAASHGIVHDLQIPGDLSLELTRAAFEFDLKKSQFRLSADSAHGEAFFIASNANQTWGFVFGILMKLADISGVPDFGLLSLKSTMLILSTIADDSFQVPSLPAVPPAVGRQTFPAIGSTKMRLRKGVIVAALLELSGGGNPILAQLGRLLGKGELLIQVTISDGNVSFVSYMDGSLTLDMGVEKLVLSNPSVRIDPGPTAGFFVAGTVLIPFNQVTLEATGALSMSDVGMEAMLQVTAQSGVTAQGDATAQSGRQPASLPTPFGLRGVSLDELDIEVGVVFEPPGVDFGIEGKFNIMGQQRGVNNFIIVLDPKTGIPNPIYLSAYVQSLTISDLITAVSGEVVSDIPDFIKSIKGEELSVYWSESAGIALPDGRLAQQGFGFNGFISIGGFSAHAALTVSEINGVSGDAELRPINLGGVFSLKGQGKGVKVNQVQVNGEWQTITKPPETDEEKKLQTREYQLIDAGGAAVTLNTKHSPYIDVSASVSLFNLLNAEVEIEVSNSGFKWKQKESIGSLFKTEIDCTLSTTSGFSAKAEFDIDIKGDVGPIEILGVDFGSIDLDISFGASMSIAVSKDPSVTVSGYFHFEGFNLTVEEFALSDFQSFEQLPDKILKQIQDNADDIFEDVFNAAGAFLKAAAAEAEKIGKEAAEEAEKIGAAAAQQAEKIGADAKAVYDGAAHDVAAAGAAAEQAGKQAEQIIASVDGEITDIGNAAADDAKKLEGQAEEVGKEAAAQVIKIGDAAAKEAAQIAADAEKVFSDAGAEAVQIGKDAEKAAEAAIEEAGKLGKALLEDADAAVNAMAQEGERIGREIASKVAEKAKEAAEWAAHEAQRLADEAADAISSY
jgi:hypothetical protein